MPKKNAAIAAAGILLLAAGGVAAVVALSKKPPSGGKLSVTIDARGAPKFAAIVSGGVPPYSYSWMFGDGTAGSGASPTHTYTTAGTFAISVVVTDAIGGTASGKTTFTVSSTPPPPSPGVITQIQVLSSATAAQTGVPITVSGKAVDQYGKAMAGVALYLWEAMLGADYMNEGSVIADASGTAKWSVTFANPGNYDIVVSGSSSSSTAPVPSNTIAVAVTSPPPPPQSTFQLIPGHKVKVPLPVGVTNMGLQILRALVNVGAPYQSEVLIIGGIGRTVTFGGLETAWSDINQTRLIGTGIEYKVIDSGQVDAYNNEIYLAQSVGNDGACYIQADVDGNYLTITFYDSLGNVLATLADMRPGNQYDTSYGKLWGWGGAISILLVDMDQYAAYIAAGGVGGGAYNVLPRPANSYSWGSYNVVAQVIQLVLPSPVLQIADLGVDTTALGADVHKLQASYYDVRGNPLKAVTNPISIVLLPGAYGGSKLTISNGMATFDTSGSAGSGTIVKIELANGPILSDGTPYTPNTVVSPTITVP